MHLKLLSSFMLHYHLGLVLTLKWLGCRNYYKLLISLCVNIFKEVLQTGHFRLGQ